MENRRDLVNLIVSPVNIVYNHKVGHLYQFLDLLNRQSLATCPISIFFLQIVSLMHSLAYLGFIGHVSEKNHQSDL